MLPRTRNKLYIIFTNVLLWIVWTNLIIQFTKYNNNNPPEAKQLHIAEDTYEVDQRASVCFKDVVPFSIPLIQGSEICQNKPDLLIMIHTKPDNFEMRNTFRDKFTNRIRNISRKYNFNVDVVYMIGLNERFCVLTTIIEEIITHKDILVGSFVDSYYNQTLKSITTLEWFVKYCKTASLLLKLDDRMDAERSLGMDDFYHLIRNLKLKEKIIIGSTNDEQISNYQRLPWISQPHLYPGLPQHLRLNYLLSRDSAENLLKAYADSIYISVWQEDLYITGILVNIARTEITHDENFLLECGEIICLFCNCSTPNETPSEQRPELSKRLFTKKNPLLIIPNELAHSIPKRDTERSHLITATDPIVGTDNTSEWSMTDSTDTTAGTASTRIDEFQIATIGMETTFNNLQLTTNHIETTIAEIKTTTTTVERSTDDSSENFSSAEAARDTSTVVIASTDRNPTTMESSTITGIPEAVWITDIPALQINEYEPAFQVILQDAEDQRLTNTMHTKTNNYFAKWLRNNNFKKIRNGFYATATIQTTGTTM